MNLMQKEAWFVLAVIVVTVFVVAGLYPWIGARATGGFGLLGLIGFWASFVYLRRGKRVICDERDTLIRQRAYAIAYSVLWVVFCIAALAAPSFYGAAIPTVVVQNCVWVAFMILLGVQSVAVLAQYGRGKPHAE